jgi:lipopolysaccharide/colanic/teichoic acid biosynthesis glycosyltransferase
MNRLATVRMAPPRPPAVGSIRPPWVVVRPAAPVRRRRERTYPGKTAFDTVLAAGLLVASFPVLLAAAGLIRATSRGPIIYTQRRLGRGGRPFVIYKLRTMRHDCERTTGPVWATPNDPRATAVGRVLRALHLDELPQLWNVLRGEMSLIGPRPERPEIAGKLRHLVPGYDRRLAVRPGITGLAQVFLPPDSDVDGVRRKVALDRLYVARLGPGFDVKILTLTALKLCGLWRVKPH